MGPTRTWGDHPSSLEGWSPFLTQVCSCLAQIAKHSVDLAEAKGDQGPTPRFLDTKRVKGPFRELRSPTILKERAIWSYSGFDQHILVEWVVGTHPCYRFTHQNIPKAAGFWRRDSLETTTGFWPVVFETAMWENTPTILGWKLWVR